MVLLLYVVPLLMFFLWVRIGVKYPDYAVVAAIAGSLSVCGSVAAMMMLWQAIAP